MEKQKILIPFPPAMVTELKAIEERKSNLVQGFVWGAKLPDGLWGIAPGMIGLECVMPENPSKSPEVVLVKEPSENPEA
jgi:hypothetical protein